MSKPKPIRRTLLALLAGGLAILTGAVVLPASAGPADPAGGPIRAGNAVTTVTLITGDQVWLSKRAGGYSAIAEPAPGRTGVVFGTQRRGDTLWVYPNDAVPLIASGRLDRRLFEVSALAAQGYGDQVRGTIPLIVQHSKGKPVTKLPAGATKVRELASASSTVTSQDKKSATSFWTWLTGTTKSLPGRRSTLGGAFTDGVRTVWLDGRMRATLDRSVPQVGAPVAWKKGYTGKGVKVAVLDTGIDSTHLDLKGAVTASANFSESPDAVDRFGHGTHVASIITGSGARSSGKYKGVAPDAALLNGKVLDDEGYGTESGIIAGMEWAVSQKARVVNLSLGGWPNEGLDPVDLALNELSRSSGALFVVAAGNGGPGRYTVTTPSTATEALSVAATDRDQTVADFSSAGPRLGDYAVKPEIAAPGRDIVAARAAGTELGPPVGKYYVKASGTSMATPHVAGAAAILAQQQPTWSARLLKAALMGTAKLPASDTVFRQGAGFLDVSRAVTQKVFTLEGSLSANLRWPHTQKATRTLTYRNPSASPLQLNLGFNPKDQYGNAVATGVFGLPTSVTIPPRTTAKVTLTIDPTRSKPGLLYHGRINATASGVVVRTPVSVNIEPETYQVTLDITDRNGNKVTSYEQGQLAQDPVLIDLANYDRTLLLRPRDGSWVVRAPRGAYTIALHLLTPTASGTPSSTLYAVPRITATAPVALKLDAREANRATAVVDVAGARTTEVGTTLVQQIGPQIWWTDIAVSSETGEPQAYVMPSPATSRMYQFNLHQALQAADRTYELAFGNRGSLPADPSYPVSDSDLADLMMIIGAHNVKATGTYLHELATNSDDTPVWSGHQFQITMPTTRHHLVSTSVLGTPITWYSGMTAYTQTGDWAYDENLGEGRYQPGQSATVKLSTAAFSPQALGFHESDAYLGLDFGPFNSSGGGWIYTYNYPNPVQGDVVLKRDGVVISDSDDPYFVSTSQAGGTATYTAIMHASRRALWSGYVPRVSGTWTFTSTAPTDQSRSLPVISTRVSGAFDGWGRAPAGKVFPLTLNIAGTDGEVATVTVRVSYDDGKNWTTVPVGNDSGEWVADVSHPSTITNPWVSLRVIVTDTAGNSGGWTAYRSYKIANLG
ncbi:S8 family peptidase [Flindersiella endophytica]